MENNSIPEHLLKNVFLAMLRGNSGEYGYGHIRRVAEQALVSNTFAEASQLEMDLYVVGLCHDVVEDGFATYDDLATWGLTPTQIDAVRLLTRVEYQPYRAYIDSLVAAYNTNAGKIAVKVKVHDIFDHLSPHHIEERSKSGAARYLDALHRLSMVQVVRD